MSYPVSLIFIALDPYYADALNSADSIILTTGHKGMRIFSVSVYQQPTMFPY